ncbi:cation:proton antiporter [Nocardioides donggukensis]|uniref:Cation:proton antiporter n=1 Tax=Nocardioides donggukensis TaxID=2774019 RepID=A0A927Q319_9ACTN|nr:cation:proton antiporter [Nocardioides donggukensis]MBD8870181.1 cation:proton antiporter [Nocardioides donggukensis]
MLLLLSFALVLLLAVLLSGLAHRTVLSTAVVFLIAGFLLGDGMTGVLDLAPDDEIVVTLAELALFSVLFTDGMRVGLRDLTSAWRLPGRALALGLPLTLLITALAAHYVAGLDWTESLLLGAVLAPTDPVFAAALVGNEKVPGRLRHLLNVESGVNDGLALPFVIVLLAVASGSEDLHIGLLALELGLGLVIGVGIPYLALRLEDLRVFAASTAYEPLNAVAIGLTVLAVAEVTHANLFLAAFAAGVTVATRGHSQKETFEEFGELVAELLKLGALLVFGALITPTLLAEVPWTGWVFALVALFVARPVALAVSFRGSRLGPREQLAAAWFGPKGFASVVYGLLVLSSGITEAGTVFDLVAITVVLSILLHSSTDVVVARWFDETDETPTWRGFGRRSRSDP